MRPAELHERLGVHCAPPVGSIGATVPAREPSTWTGRAGTGEYLNEYHGGGGVNEGGLQVGTNVPGDAI